MSLSFALSGLCAVALPIGVAARRRTTGAKNGRTPAIALPPELQRRRGAPPVTAEAIERHARATMARDGKGAAIALVRAASGLGLDDARACVDLL